MSNRVPPLPSIIRQEWYWLIGYSLLYLLLINTPYLYGAAISPPAHTFSGHIIGIEDGNSYLAKMQQGQAGYWLFHLTYTPEPHQGELFFLYYILLGKLVALTGLSNILVYHLSKIITIPFALIAFYHLVAYFTSQINIRRLALIFLTATAGLGWLWVILNGTTSLGQMPVDLWVPDASFFLSAITYPHLPLAQGLLFLLVLFSLHFLEQGEWPCWLGAALCGLLVSLIHPYTLPIISLLLGCYLLRYTYSQPRQLFVQGVRLFLIILPSSPYLIYVLTVFTRNPAFVIWREQSLTYSPTPLHYLLGFGLPLLLAGLGLWLIQRLPSKRYTFLQIWLLLVPFLLYFPIPLQRRFLDGYQAPLAIFAALGLVWLGEKTSQLIRLRALIIPILLFIMSLTNVFLLGGATLTVTQHSSPFFTPTAALKAITWLAPQAQNEVILASYQTGNLLPAHAPVRAFVGHGPETLHSTEKQALVKRFFSRQVDDDWRIALLQEYHVRFLFYGANERALGNFDPKQAPYLQEIYSQDEIQIFAVTN